MSVSNATPILQVTIADIPSDAQFATSSYGLHTIVSTISTVNAIMAAVAQPFIAKIADLISRPWALTISIFFYTLGFIIVAASKNVQAVVAGQVIYTLGTTGINQVMGILIADITSLQWRGAVQGAYSLPWALNAFVAGYISSDISAYSENGWRWGVSLASLPLAI
jgi:MFS family permease